VRIAMNIRPADGESVVKHVFDGVAIVGLPAHFIGIHLGDIYTILGCIWLGFRIVESRTFQHMLKRWRD